MLDGSVKALPCHLKCSQKPPRIDRRTGDDAAPGGNVDLAVGHAESIDDGEENSLAAVGIVLIAVSVAELNGSTVAQGAVGVMPAAPEGGR